MCSPRRYFTLVPEGISGENRALWEIVLVGFEPTTVLDDCDKRPESFGHHTGRTSRLRAYTDSATGQMLIKSGVLPLHQTAGTSVGSRIRTKISRCWLKGPGNKRIH